jgi:hypothetical protein
LFPYIPSQFVCCWCIEKLMIFVSWFCILPPCYSCLWCLRVLGYSFFGSLRFRIISCANRDILTVFLPICVPFISSSHLMLWLKIPVLCWIGVRRVGFHVSFLILGEMVSVLHH